MSCSYCGGQFSAHTASCPVVRTISNAPPPPEQPRDMTPVRPRTVDLAKSADGGVPLVLIDFQTVDGLQWLVGMTMMDAEWLRKRLWERRRCRSAAS